MNYPQELLSNNRKVLADKDILDEHFIYRRHKLGHDWNEGDPVPDFDKISVSNGTSHNWSAFSIPMWVRFDVDKQYLEDRGIAGYMVDTFRNTEKYENGIPSNTINIIHKPEEINYSHCELKHNTSLTKAMRRQLRIVIRRKCVIHAMPNEIISSKKNNDDYAIMKKHRAMIDEIT